MRKIDPDLPALSPCPFCGGPAMLIGHEEHWIECQECEANTAGYSTQDAAVAAWNRRVVAAIPGIPTIASAPAAGTLHPATVDLIGQFMAALARKLRDAELKHNRTIEWRDPDRVRAMRTELHKNIHKGDPLDVAAYAAFLWYHNASSAFDDGAKLLITTPYTDYYLIDYRYSPETGSLPSALTVAGLYLNGETLTAVYRLDPATKEPV